MINLFRYIAVKEKVMKAIFFSCAIFSIISLLLIMIYLFINGLPFIGEIGFFNFIFGTVWSPISENPSYGIFNMIITTIYVTALAMVFSSILGIFTAIALYKFINKKFVKIIANFINLLAGIPSVIYGLFGIKFIVPFVRDYISNTGVGYGIFSTSLVLAIMVLPTIVSISLDSLRSVSNKYYEGALALGATKELATFKVMLPVAKSGIFASLVLGTGRALGETMAVIMIIGGSTQFPTSLFESVRTLTSNIAMGANELSADQNTLGALVASGVVLFVFAFLINISFSLIKNYKRKRK